MPLRIASHTSANKLSPQAGNVLFLILIAVALFAGLSYVVTQSTRSGGNITKERAKLIAAQQLQKIQDIQSAILRLQLQGYQQIFFDRTAPDYGGTCYDGAQTRTPCKTIGIFHESTGVVLPTVSTATIPADRTFRYWSYWSINSGPLRVNGETLVTEAADLWLEIWPVEPEVCYELNRQWRRDPEPPEAFSNYTHSLGKMSSGYDVTPPVSSISDGVGVSTSVPDLPGTRFCEGEPEWGHTIYYVLREQ